MFERILRRWANNRCKGVIARLRRDKKRLEEDLSKAESTIRIQEKEIEELFQVIERNRIRVLNETAKLGDWNAP